MQRHIVQLNFGKILGVYTSQTRAMRAIVWQFPGAVISSFKPTVYLDDNDTRIEIISMHENYKLTKE
jgi:hypothetical protein